MLSTVAFLLLPNHTLPAITGVTWLGTCMDSTGHEFGADLLTAPPIFVVSVHTAEFLGLSSTETLLSWTHQCTRRTWSGMALQLAWVGAFLRNLARFVADFSAAVTVNSDPVLDCEHVLTCAVLRVLQPPGCQLSCTNKYTCLGNLLKDSDSLGSAMFGVGRWLQIAPGLKTWQPSTISVCNADGIQHSTSRNSTPWTSS